MNIAPSSECLSRGHREQLPTCRSHTSWRAGMVRPIEALWCVAKPVMAGNDRLVKGLCSRARYGHVRPVIIGVAGEEISGDHHPMTNTSLPRLSTSKGLAGLVVSAM